MMKDADLSSPVSGGGGQASDMPSIPQMTADELLSHPRFPEAAFQHIRISLVTSTLYPFVRELFGDAARQMVFVYVAMMSGRSAQEAGEPVLTPGRLHKALKPWGFSHRGKVDLFLNRLTDLGLIEKQPNLVDRRTPVIRPTEEFFVVFDRLIAPHVVPAALLVQDAFLTRLVAGERSAAERYVAFGAFQPETSFQMLQSVPEMLAFVRHDSGWLILFVLIDAVAKNDHAACKPAAIARFLGVSRPHVSNVLNSAFELGLLEEIGPGVLAPTSSLSKAVDRWIAECFAAAINFVYRARE